MSLTQIGVDDDALAEAMRLSEAKTKKDTGGSSAEQRKTRRRDPPPDRHG